MKTSRTIVAAIVSALGGVFMILGSPLDEATMKDLGDSINVAIGSGMVAYGALMAVLRKITSTPLAGWFNKV